MKKIILTALILAAAGGSVFAERLYLIQGTYMGTSRTYEESGTEEKQRYGEFGLSFTSFSGHGVGFYTSASFLIPVDYSFEVNGRDSGQDIVYLTQRFNSLTLGLDLLLGIGINAPVTKGLSILAAGGIHFNGIVLVSDLDGVEPNLAYNLGPGAAVNALLYLTPSLNVNVGVLAAWDMVEFVHIPELGSSVDAKGGLTFAVSAGLGISY